MLTLGAYALWVERPSLGRYLAVAGFFALGLMSKPIVVTLPFVLVLLDYWPLGRFRPATAAAARQTSSWLAGWPIGWRLAVEKLPLVALSAVSSAIVLFVHKPMKGEEDIEPLSLATRGQRPGFPYAAYLGQSFWPIDLSPFTAIRATPCRTAWVVASLVLLLAITALAVLLSRRQPYLLVGSGLWFLGMLVPVSGLVGTFAHSRADRYTYLSQIGLAIAVAWGARAALGRWQSSDRASWRNRMLPIVASAAVVALAVAGWRQTRCWYDTETIWTRAVSVTRDNTMAHYCLATVYAAQGKLDEAIAQCRAAVATPSIARYATADAYVLWGECLVSQDKIGEAIPYFEEAIRVSPNQSTSHTRLAIALFRSDRRAEAIREFREAARSSHGSPAAQIDLANAAVSQWTKPAKRPTFAGKRWPRIRV